jgi:hypothetical protein
MGAGELASEAGNTMREIKIAMGTVDCHFEQNYRIALDNFHAGRPLFEGQLAPTVIPDPRYPSGYMTLVFEDKP